MRLTKDSASFETPASVYDDAVAADRTGWGRRLNRAWYLAAFALTATLAAAAFWTVVRPRPLSSASISVSPTRAELAVAAAAWVLLAAALLVTATWALKRWKRLK